MNKKIVYSLIFLVIIYFISITFYTFLKFKTVTNFTKVYTSNTWKIDGNNGLRVAFLKYMNKTSFLPFKLKLELITKKKNIILIDDKFKASLLNKEIFIKNDILPGDAKLNGKIFYDNKMVDNFIIDIKLKREFEQNSINIANRVVKDEDTEKMNEFSRFSEYRAGKYTTVKNLKIQFFSLTKDLIFSNNNEIFILSTLPDYSPIQLSGELLTEDFFSKNKKFNIETDPNGLTRINSLIYNTSGVIKFENGALKKEIEFFVSPKKTSISSKKLFYKDEKTITFDIKAFKKMDSLYFSAFIGNQWVANRKVTLINKRAVVDFDIPKNFTGFIDFVIYRNYSYGSDLSTLKVFVGSKESLDKRLIDVDNYYIRSIVSANKTNPLFYKFAISQLKTEFKDPPLQFNSFTIQENKIKSYKKKYSSFLWYTILIISIFMISLVYLLGILAIKESDKTTDYDFRSKGKSLYLYFLIGILALFLWMILFILKII